MTEDGRTLRHLAFFEELASLDDADPTWRAVTAGLVTLRLVDAWTNDGASVAADAWGVRAVRSAIDEIGEMAPARAILDGLVTALVESPPGSMHAIAPRLIAYARLLEYEARWSLAADVYRTVIAHAHPIEDSDFAIDAQLQLGVCLRQLGALDEAGTAYRAAGQVAAAVGDMMGVLRSRVGEAKLAIARGNMPRAEEILDRTIEAAQGDTMRAVRVSARNDRAHVAALRGDYEFSIRIAYEALREAEIPAERDRLLSDIGTAFADLGVYSAARDAYLVLTVTAQEQYVRWAASLNLLDIARKTGAEPAFERYRRELASAEMPPYLAVHRAMYVGQGLVGFGRPDEGVPELERAVALATRHGYHQLSFQAEEALAEARRAERVQRRATSVFVAPSESLEGIAQALREMREEAGVGG